MPPMVGLVALDVVMMVQLVGGPDLERRAPAKPAPFPFSWSRMRWSPLPAANSELLDSIQDDRARVLVMEL